MTGSQILTAIIELLMGGLVSIGEAMGAAFSALTESIFLTTVGEVTTLSTFGNMVIIFAAVALGLSLVRWCLNFITSLGQRNR